MLAGAVFLITPWSEFLWRSVPLLERVQFPWRLFALVFTGIAVVAGCGVAIVRQPLARGIVVAVASLAAASLAISRPRPSIVEVPEPQSAADLGNDFFAPDLANEWLPRGAKALRVRREERQPVCGVGVEAAEYAYGVSGLSCRIQSREASHIVLPHYFFPLGWSATLDGNPATLRPNAAGLMQVDLPANAAGIIEVRWRTTPSKWIGLTISLASVMGFAGLLVWQRRGRSNR